MHGLEVGKCYQLLAVHRVQTPHGWLCVAKLHSPWGLAGWRQDNWNLDEEKTFKGWSFAASLGEFKTDLDTPGVFWMEMSDLMHTFSDLTVRKCPTQGWFEYRNAGLPGASKVCQNSEDFRSLDQRACWWHNSRELMGH